jgi:hypothetical protein
VREEFHHVEKAHRCQPPVDAQGVPEAVRYPDEDPPGRPEYSEAKKKIAQEKGLAAKLAEGRKKRGRK